MSSYVLIPGAGGLASYWYRVEPLLRDLGHDVVSVDLPADDDRAGLGQYADAVVAAAGDRSDVILVAQSMGAFTAPLVVERLPVRLLVLLNPMVPRPGESAGAWWAATGQEAAQEEERNRLGIPPEAAWDQRVLFFHDVPDDVTELAMQHGREQSGTPFGEPWPLSGWPDVPTRVLIAREDRLFPVAFQRRVVRERLGFAPDEMDGGHLVALSRPADLVGRLEAYRRELEAEPAVSTAAAVSPRTGAA